MQFVGRVGPGRHGGLQRDAQGPQVGCRAQPEKWNIRFTVHVVHSTKCSSVRSADINHQEGFDLYQW